MPPDMTIAPPRRMEPRHDPAPRPPGAARLRDLAPAAGLLVIGLTGLLVASASGPGRGGQYLVVAAPWSGRAGMVEIIGAAEGGLVELGGFGNIAVAASARADFPARARRAGAWAVLPAPVIAGCFGEGEAGDT